jgi:hypothetical protein
MIYAGIGSRKTPYPVLQLMTTFAEIAGQRDWVLRSGGAVGADSAFHKGAVKVKGQSEIYLPERNDIFVPTNITKVFNHPTYTAEKIAAEHHPAWHLCKPFSRKLHARNAHIVLGADLRQPVNAVVCWTPPGFNQGGTGLALSIARSHGIPIFNLGTVWEDFAAAEMLAGVLVRFHKD